MKKVLMVLCFCSTMIIVYAQTPEAIRQQKEQERKVSKTGKKTEDWAEIFASYNYSTKTGSNPDYSPISGIQFGIHTTILNISDDIRLGIGAAYSMQGGRYESMEYTPGDTYGGTSGTSSSTSSATSRLNYLNFPILARYQRQPYGVFAEAGVQPGILLSAKDNDTDIKDEVEKFDIGIPVGVGYHFKNKFWAGLRVTPGLLNINKNSEYK